MVCKIAEVNRTLQDWCTQNSWGFVHHSNVSTPNHLNDSGLQGFKQVWNLSSARNFKLFTLRLGHCPLRIRLDWWAKTWEAGKFNCSSIFGWGLVIASLNISSLLSHINELRVFMYDSEIAILLINETKLDSTIHDSNVYTWLRNS